MLKPMIMPLTNPDELSAQRGRAQLTVESVSGQSAVTSAFASTPMKLLTPRSRGQSVWAYTSSFGGGFVAGDETRLDLRIGKGARCFLGTQASTKIYRNPRALACGHVTQATVEENALLVFAPDPVQPFADSSYAQRQTFHLGTGAGLVLVDWFTSGRAARGERWAFNHFQSRNEVWSAPLLPLPARNDRGEGWGEGQFKKTTFSPRPSPPLGEEREKIFNERVFLDSLLLDSAAEPITSPHRTGRFNCFALLLLAGEPLQSAAAGLLETISVRPVKRSEAMVASASPVRHGAILRVAGESVEQVGQELHHHLKFASTLLGDDPWARKW
jgi:urease accessory protein